MVSRQIEQIVIAVPASDGDGVKLKRVMGQLSHELMDPFLMLDELRSDHGDGLGGGFPPHPHRGIETVSVMLQGGFRHEDHMGNCREITTGGMQWMKSGRGVVHSEMPILEGQRMHGFQLWLNLPAKDKMTKPEYRDIEADDISDVELTDGYVRILAGELAVDGTVHQGAMHREVTQPLILDLLLNKGSQHSLNIVSEKAMFYVYQGKVNVQGQWVEKGCLARLGAGDVLDLSVAEEDVGLLLLGGQPLKESVVQYGPFVMNAQEEIEQAMMDYRNGVLAE